MKIFHGVTPLTTSRILLCLHKQGHRVDRRVPDVSALPLGQTHRHRIGRGRGTDSAARFASNRHPPATFELFFDIFAGLGTARGFSVPPWPQLRTHSSPSSLFRVLPWSGFVFLDCPQTMPLQCTGERLNPLTPLRKARDHGSPPTPSCGLVHIARHYIEQRAEERTHSSQHRVECDIRSADYCGRG